MHDTAAALGQESAVSEAAGKLFQEVAAKSEHLHHLDLAGARKEFKPISRAVVTLAAQVRSSDAKNPFTHFFCPMVPDGGADWLQSTGDLLNPYFGGEMLRCGDKVREFPAPGNAAPTGETHPGHDAKKAGA